MATPRAQQEDPEAAYAATRDKAIEAFVQDPSYGKGVSVRKTDFGTREFSSGGGSVYTWSANQEKADRDAAARIDDGKTFAEILTAELPSRLAVAKRLWTEGGDEAGARAELDALDKFARENRDTLRTLTRYQGRDDLAKGVADQARGLLSGSYRIEFATMARDPEIRAKSAQKRALDMGLDADSADVYTRMTAGHDPEAIALWNAAGAPANADPKPGSSGRGATPQAARAAAAGIDPADIKGFLGYAKTAGAKLAGNIEKPVLDLMSPDDRAKALRMSYDSGDKESGGGVLGVVSGVVRKSEGLDDRGKLNLFQSALSAVSEGVRAWNADGTPRDKARAVKVLGALSEVLPGAAFAGQHQQVTETMKTVSGALSKFRDFGIDFSDDTASAYAKVIFNRTYRSSVPLTGEEARLSGVMNRANLLGNNIKVSGGFVDAGKEPVEKGGYDILAGMAKEHVQAAAAAAMSNGTTVEAELDARAAGLEQALQALGVEDAEKAKNGARLLSQVIASGKEVDFSDLPNILGQHSLVRDLVGQANGKDVRRESLAPATAPKQAELDKLAPDAALVQNIKDVNPGQRDLFTPGFGDKNATINGFVSAARPAVSSVAGEQSPMFRYLYSEVPTADLGKDSVRESAVAKFLESYQAVLPTAFAGSDPAKLREVALKQVRGVLSNMAAEAAALGVSPTISLSASLGDTDAETQRRLATVRVAPTSGTAKIPFLQTLTTGGGGSPVPNTLVDAPPDSLARDLASAFFSDVEAQVPEGERGFAVAAKTKLRNLGSLPTKIPAPVAGAADAQDIPLNIARLGKSEQVRSGYEALKQVSERLGQPIKSAAVRQLVLKDLPELMQGMPRSAQMRGRRVSIQMAYAGNTTDEILTAFESAFSKEEQRALEAKLAAKAAEIKLRNGAQGVNVLGDAEAVEVSPGTK